MSELQNPLFDEEKEFLERKKLEYERALRGDVAHLKEQSVQVGKVAAVGAGLAGSIWLIIRVLSGRSKRRRRRDAERERNAFADYNGEHDEYFDDDRHEADYDDQFGANYFTAGNGQRYRSKFAPRSAADSARVFADAAGALLDRMLAAIGRSRGDTYLANAVQWPGAGAAAPAEAAAAAPFFRRQIALARPKAILALGQDATAALTGSTLGIARMRGKWLEVDGVAVLPTFAPAHLLRQPAHKALAWSDLCDLKAKLA